MTDQLTTNETIGGTPGGGDGAPPATPGTPVPVSANITHEYVAATGTAFYGNYWRSLRWAFDDVTEDFGDDLYDRMLRDPQIIACLNVLKAGILEDGAQLRPAVDDKDDPAFDQAMALADQCGAMLDDLNPSLDDVLWNMLDGLALGHKVAEIIYDPDTMQVAAVKVKPRHSTAFVVDVYSNVVGLLARIPGLGVPVQAGTYILGGMPPYNLLPREKFAVFSFRPKDNDPRGTSILRPAYNAWWLKMQTWPQYLKFLVQFGTPSLVGYTAESSNAYTLPGQGQISAEDALLAKLIQFQNGTALALPGGSKVEPIDVAGSGVEAFIKAFDLYDRQMTTAILHQTLATMEGQHQARAASQTHQTVLNTIVRQAKRAVQRMIRNDILRPYIRFTYGPEAEALAPHVTLGSAEQQDMSTLWTALANLARTNYLDPSQYPALDDLANLPPRSAEDIAARLQARAAGMALASNTQPGAQTDGAATNPDAPGVDDTQEGDNAADA